MPPAKEPREAKDSGITLEEFQLYQKDQELLSEMLAELRKEVQRMTPVVEDLRVSVSTMAPSRSEIPPEVLSKIRPDVAYAAALQGTIIGLLQIAGPSVTKEHWKTWATKAVEMAEVTFKIILEKATDK